MRRTYTLTMAEYLNELSKAKSKAQYQALVASAKQVSDTEVKITTEGN
jgi:hypothetical protein